MYLLLINFTLDFRNIAPSFSLQRDFYVTHPFTCENIFIYRASCSTCKFAYTIVPCYLLFHKAQRILFKSPACCTVLIEIYIHSTGVRRRFTNIYVYRTYIHIFEQILYGEKTSSFFYLILINDNIYVLFSTYTLIC